MAHSNPVKLSIVVPAYNEEKLIASSLGRINKARQALEGFGWESELIVCDNNSTDRTAALARTAGAQVVFEPVNQIARARNTGAGVARGEWLLFIDADSRPEPALLADLASKIAKPGWIGGGCTVHMDQKLQWFWRLWVALWNTLSRWTRWPAGSFFACETEAFRALGGFNTALYASEEVDLARRLKRLGLMTGRRLFILRKHPLVTSSRKLRLYTRGEIVRTILRSMMRPKKYLTSREACYIWYDGRR